MSAIFAVVLITPKPMVDFCSRALGTREEPDVQNSTLIILVVEDEPLIQDMVQEALFDGGFKTEMASSGEAAITLLGDNEGKYRALITDIHLGGKSMGWDVARRARELDQEIPVVYMTGAGADKWRSHGVPESILLNKPFAPAQVVTAVSQLLNHLPPLRE
jgi:DNA-binding response OmpR family regulator